LSPALEFETEYFLTEWIETLLRFP